MNFNCKPLLVSTLVAAALGGALSGCAPLIIGGAAVGAMVTFDRRTSGAQLEDEGIELRGASRLREAMGDRAHVNITSYNRQVLLTGEVPNEQAKQTAEQVVSRVDNVKGIVNDLAVMGQYDAGPAFVRHPGHRQGEGLAGRRQDLYVAPSRW
jgi:osmotically-inducible protein OsmY